jgi:crossover junction endodeoxyribonuclease RuvC
LPHGGRRAAAPLTILGIDPGLDRTGYAVIRMPECRVIDAGVIVSQAPQPLPRRLVEIGAGLAEVLAEHRLDLVAVEDLFAHYRHPRTAILMGHARGVVLRAVADRGLPVASLPATKVKKLLTGNGHAGKPQIQRAVCSTFHLRKPPEPPDVADALAVAWCAAYLHRATATAPRAGPPVGRKLAVRRRGKLGRPLAETPA